MGLRSWLRADAVRPPDGWKPPVQRGGALVRGVAFVVRRAENLSPGNRLSARWRAKAQDAEPRLAEYCRLRAAQIVDGWIAVCVALEVVLLAVDVVGASAIRFAGAVLASLRLAEICAVWAYAVLFEQADFERRTGRPYDVVALPRSLIHAVVMIGEVTLCFAILANALRSQIDGVASALDALDYSMRTLTTVGVFGEADGLARFVVNLEPFIGLLFVAAVVARLIGGVPEMQRSCPPDDPPGTAR